MEFRDAAADQLRQREFARLSDTVTPRIEAYDQ